MPSVSAAISRTIQSSSERAATIESLAGRMFENASALTAPRRTCESASVVAAVSAGTASSSLRKPITPTACARTEASVSRSASSATLSASLRRSSFNARSALIRTKACEWATSGKIASALAGSFSSAMLSAAAVATGGFRVDQQLDQRGGGFRAVEFAERERDLLTHAGVRVGDHAVEQLHGGRIARIRKLDDGDAALARIGRVQLLLDVVQIVIGLEQLGHGSPQQSREC